MRGMTGTPDQVDQVTRAFRVYFSKNAEPGDEEDYLLDHSIFMYLMDPNFKFVDYFGVNLTEEQITEKIKLHLQSRGAVPPDNFWGKIKHYFSQ
jgi:protein SCO1/2